MASKENKGGLLKNDQVEQDLKVKGKTAKGEGYEGSQDTGDRGVRQTGTDVQKRDGQPSKDESEEI